MKYFCTLAFVLVALSIPSILAKERIVGGQETQIESVPYIAALQYHFETLVFHVCGAAIISTKYLLTAARCLSDNGITLYARVGSTNYKEGGQLLKVDNYTLDEDHDYDFTILNFEPGVEINLGPKVAVIPLPTGNDPSDGSSITVAGWGYTTDVSTSYSLNLRKVDLPVVNFDRCKTFYPELDSRQLCVAGTAQGNINFCLGDSGGPAVQNGILYGIMFDISADGCEEPNIPSVLGRVSAIKDWIALVTGVK